MVSNALAGQCLKSNEVFDKNVQSCTGIALHKYDGRNQDCLWYFQLGVIVEVFLTPEVASSAGRSNQVRLMGGRLFSLVVWICSAFACGCTKRRHHSPASMPTVPPIRENLLAMCPQSAFDPGRKWEVPAADKYSSVGKNTNTNQNAVCDLRYLGSLSLEMWSVGRILATR
jgi:hypothetical protein